MLTLRIALRYLFSKKSHQAVNIISYISMGGVAIASASMIIVLSVFNGFADFTAQQLSVVTPDLLVKATEGKVVTDADHVAEALSRIEGVSKAESVIEEKALAVLGDRQAAITLVGREPDASGYVGAIEPYIIDGDAYIGDQYGVTLGLLSVGTANSLRPSAYSNQWIKIYEPKREGRFNPARVHSMFRADSLLPTGVFRIDNPDYDADRLIVPLRTARQLLNYEDEATNIEVTLAPGSDVETVRKAVEKVLGEKFSVKTRHEQNEQAFRMINIEKWITLLMLAFILVIASFNILSTLSMLIVEKRDNMSILSALGALPSMAGKIFSKLSFLISAFGGAIGIVLGIGLSLAQQFGGFIKLNAHDMSAMAIQSYPVRVNPTDVLIVAGVILLVGLVTAAVVRLSLIKKSVT